MQTAKMSPFGILFFFSIGMIVIPVGGFFASKSFVFEGMFGYSDGSVGAAITAVILIHSIIAGYVYVAWNEGTGTPVKQE